MNRPARAGEPPFRGIAGSESHARRETPDRVRKMPKYARYAWGVLIFNLAVIAWGAFVRASGSGAGCGSHWPLCNGEVVPRAARLETLIEFAHRASSGLAFFLVAGLLLWAWRAYPTGHPVRLGAAGAALFMVMEALVGAGLVLFKLVAENDSTARALAMAVHLANTFLLLACLSLTAWWAGGGKPLRWRGAGATPWLLAAGLAGMMFLGMSGAVAALGDTLFPAGSLGEGLRQDLSPTAHLLIRLRLLHPAIAVLVGAYLVVAASLAASAQEASIRRLLRRALTALILIQGLAGALNVVLLAPIWLQIVHLLLSDAIWITLVLYTASALARVEAEAAPPEISPTAALAGAPGEL